MASNHNPFATWSAGNGYSSNSTQNSAPPPSIVGALPYPHPPSYPLPPDEIISFTFTSFNPTILNCTVLGPHNRPYFQVVTDASMPGYTLWKDAERKNIALVEWQNTPLLEARGILTKQQITNWLRLAPDRRFVLLISTCPIGGVSSWPYHVVTGHWNFEGIGTYGLPIPVTSVYVCRSSHPITFAHRTDSFTQQVPLLQAL